MQTNSSGPLGPARELVLAKAPRSLYKQRISNFCRARLDASPDDEPNLFSRIYSKPAAQLPKLLKYSVPDLNRIPFHEAVRAEFVPTEVGVTLGPGWSTHWFKIQCVIPSEWEGKTVVFVFNADCEGLIYNTDGSLVHGLVGGDVNDDRRRTDYILSESAVGGETYNFYIEVACNGLFGIGENNLIAPPRKDATFQLTEAHLRAVDTDAAKLYSDLLILKEISSDVDRNMTPRVDQALIAANDIINVFSTSGDIKACLEISNAFFAPKSHQGPATHKVVATGHCHIDTAWLWPYSETRRKIARSWSSQIYLMNKFPEHHFSCSQAQQYEWLKEDHPETFARLKEKVRQGNFIPVGGSWVEFDGNLPNGESLVRQFLVGQRFFHENFGIYCRVFWLPDTFGYTAQLPQLSRQAQMPYFFTQKLSWNNINKFPHTSFHWEALDARSSVLTHFCPSDTYCARVSGDEIAKHASVDSNRDLGLCNSSLLLFGHGDGGGGPSTNMLERLRRLRCVDGLPSVEAGSPNDFFARLEKSGEASRLSRWRGELYFELHRGTYTSQAKVKRGNRICEQLLRDVEICYSLLPCAEYPADELLKFWKIVLLNQFHDVLPGSSINLVYQDTHVMHAEVIEQASSLLERGFKSMIQNSKKNNKEDEPVRDAVFNSCGWMREEVLSENNGEEAEVTFVQAEPFSWTQVSLSAPNLLGHEVKLSVRAEDVGGGATLENSIVRYELNGCGEILSLYDKRAERFIIGSRNSAIRHEFRSDISSALDRGNVFRMYSDVPLFWDAWDLEFYHLGAGITTEGKSNPQRSSKATFKILENGPLRVRAQVSRSIGAGSSITQDIELCFNSAILKFRVSCDWHEKHRVLKVDFGTSLVAEAAAFEVPFGVVYRPTHRNTSWDLARFEVCGHRFADISERDYGLSLLTDCKYGYSCLDGVMSITLLRSPTKPDADCDQGIQDFTYAVLPHMGQLSCETVRAAINLNSPLQRALVSHNTISKYSKVFSIEGRNGKSSTVVLDCIKRPEGMKKCSGSGSMIVRLYESLGSHANGTTLTCARKITKVTDVDLLEEPRSVSSSITGMPADEPAIVPLPSGKGCGVRFTMRPFEVRTLLLDFADD